MVDDHPYKVGVVGSSPTVPIIVDPVPGQESLVGRQVFKELNLKTLAEDFVRKFFVVV